MKKTPEEQNWAHARSYMEIHRANNSELTHIKKTRIWNLTLNRSILHISHDKPNHTLLQW